MTATPEGGRSEDHPRKPTLSEALAPVASLLISVSMLLMGNGLQGTLVPVRGNMAEFSPLDLGVLGTAYFIGFTIGCLDGPRLVERAGHIRAYLAMASLASVISLLHAIIIEPVTWWVLRAVTGYCFAVLYIVIESWLNARSENATRGTVFAIYTAINLTVISLGQLMLTLEDPASFELFALASILVSLAALPLAFTASASPAVGSPVRPRLRKIYEVSPVGFAGCFAVGLANGSFWALGPVFAQNIGFDRTGIALFMSAIVIGGAIGQWPLGTISDRMDRRIVIVAASLLAMGAAVSIMIGPANDTVRIIVLGAIFGAGALPLYTLSVAHANDYANAEDYVEISSGLLLVFGVGAAVGPLMASLAREALDVPSLFIFTAAVHALLAAYVMWRITRRAPAPAEDRVEFAEAAIAAQTVIHYEPTPPAETVPAEPGSDED